MNKTITLNIADIAEEITRHMTETVEESTGNPASEVEERELYDYLYNILDTQLDDDMVKSAVIKKLFEDLVSSIKEDSEQSREGDR